MTAAVEKGMRVAATEVAEQVVILLHDSGKLNCTIEEARKVLPFEEMKIVSKRSSAMKKVRAERKSAEKKVSKKPSIKKKPVMLLPFCGTIEDCWCKGVRFNHGLYTQCTNGPQSGGEYCKTCQKSSDNSAASKPTYGDIRDRAVHKLDYRDPRGKQEICYANVAKKQGLDLDRAQRVATAFGWKIPAEQLVERATKRGRPGKKSPSKKSLKPKKAEKKASAMDDKIAELVAQAAEEVFHVSPDALAVAKKPTVKRKVKAEKKESPEKVAAKLAKKEAKAEKEAAKLAKKEAAEKVKAEKLAANLAKKEASDKVKAEKLAANLAKKEASDKVKAEKLAAKLAKKEAADKVKAEKLAANLAKKEAAEKVKAEKLAAKVAEKAEEDAAKVAAKAAKEALKLAEKAEKEIAKAVAKAKRKEAKELKEIEKLIGQLQEFGAGLADDARIMVQAPVEKDASRADIIAQLRKRVSAAKRAAKKAAKKAEQAKLLTTAAIVSSSEEELKEEIVTDIEFDSEFGSDEKEDDLAETDEELLVLGDAQKVYIDGTAYYISDYGETKNMLFTYPLGKEVGTYDEETGDIHEVIIED